MINRIMNIMSFSVLLTILFCVVSCGNPIRMNIPEGRLNIAPSTKKIPLKAGLFLSQSYRNTQTPIAIGAAKAGEINIGQALSSGTEKMMRDLFHEVIVLNEMGISNNLKDQNCDVIVTPQVELFELRHVAVFVSAHWKTQNIVNWRVLSPDGQEIYQNRIQSVELKIPWLDRERPEAFIEIFKDQLQKAQEDLYSNGWWKKQWWKDGN